MFSEMDNHQQHLIFRNKRAARVRPDTFET